MNKKSPVRPLRIYLSRRAEGKHSSNLFVGKLMECFRRMGVEYTHRAKDKWDVALALINADDRSIFDKGPVVQRLDGIYFNTDDDSMDSNANILKTYQSSAGVIFQSSLAKSIVSTNFGTPSRRSEVIVNGTFIDDKIDPLASIQINAPKIFKHVARFEKRLMCVGKWRQIKRLSSIVKGAQEYIADHPDTGLLIVGPMSEQDRERYADLSPNIVCLGHVPNEIVRHLQMTAHCCLNLSFTDSCPSAVIEALANGTPCVVTKFQGVIDVMKNGKDGVILDWDEWNYRPISYNKQIKELPSDLVASAIDSCVKIGRLPFRYDLSMDQVAEKYVRFMRTCTSGSL